MMDSSLASPHLGFSFLWECSCSYYPSFTDVFNIYLLLMLCSHVLSAPGRAVSQVNPHDGNTRATSELYQTPILSRSCAW